MCVPGNLNTPSTSPPSALYLPSAQLQLYCLFLSGLHSNVILPEGLPSLPHKNSTPPLPAPHPFILIPVPLQHLPLLQNTDLLDSLWSVLPTRTSAQMRQGLSLSLIAM